MELFKNPKRPNTNGTVSIGRTEQGLLFERKKVGPDQLLPVSVPMPLASVRAMAVSQLNLAPLVVNVTDAGQSGIFVLDASDSQTPDNIGTVLVTAGNLRYKRVYDGDINVKWFGAKGNDGIDDTAAIQAAINFAKANFAEAGGTYRATILFPPGFYLLTSALNLTDANGLYLRGSSGRYVNTGFIGRTGGIMVDLSGTTFGGLDGFTLLSEQGGSSPSTIGVLVALTQDANGQQKGGLNTLLNNFMIDLADVPTANGGLGSIGILNVRSEEWGATNGTILANLGVVASNQANLTPIGATGFTVTSPYATIAQDASFGSMGVSTLSNISIQNRQKRSPAIVLYNANSFFLHSGYLSRSGLANQGSNETAVLLAGSCANIEIKGTVESFSRLIRVSTALETGKFDLVSANITALGTPLIDVTGASLIQGVDVKVTMPNIPERAGRWLLWHDANANGTEPVTTMVKNSTFTCNDLAANQWAVPGWLAKNLSNVDFNINIPITKKGGAWRQTGTTTVALGNQGAVTSGVIAQFQEAAANDGSNGKGGACFITVEGLIQVGAWYVGVTASRAFRITVVINQTNFGVKSAYTPTVTMLDQSTSDQVAVNITGVTLAVTFSGGNGTLTLTPQLSGTAAGADMPITYTGEASIRSSYHAQDALIIS